MTPHKTNSRLATFLYVLMRDELTPGTIEDILQRRCLPSDKYELSNNHLAQYAEELAERLNS